MYFVLFNSFNKLMFVLSKERVAINLGLIIGDLILLSIPAIEKKSSINALDQLMFIKINTKFFKRCILSELFSQKLRV